MLLGALERRAESLGISAQVQFLGFREDIGALLEAADIVTLPSLREGLSIALLEAMSAGRALIVTSIGSNLEAVRGAALVVPVEDPKALSGAIVRLAEDATLRAELGQRAREVWERNYTIERMLKAYLETYLALLQKSSPRSRIQPHAPQ